LNIEPIGYRNAHKRFDFRPTGGWHQRLLAWKRTRAALRLAREFLERKEPTMHNIAFWRHFIRHADLLAKQMQSGNQRSVFDAIDRLLQSHDLNVCFDITTDENGCILIFSPEGLSADALLIDQLLQDAPILTNWTFLGRRPKKDLNDVAAIVRNLYALDPLQMRYRLHREEDGQVVDMIVPSSADLSLEESKGMVNTFLWHAIGEGRVMEQGIRGEVIFQDNPLEPTVSADQLMKILS
jgi:hypothetical protein